MFPFSNVPPKVGFVNGVAHRNWKKVDNRVGVDPHRWKANLSRPEFVQTLRLQTQDAGVKSKGAVNITDVEHNMIKLGNSWKVHVDLLGLDLLPFGPLLHHTAVADNFHFLEQSLNFSRRADGNAQRVLQSRRVKVAH